MFEHICALMDKGIESIRAMQERLKKAENDPEFIITGLFRPNINQPYYEFPLTVMDHRAELGGGDFRYQDLQRILADKVKEYLEGIDPDIEVGPSYSWDYPECMMIIYCGDALLRFELYTHRVKDLRVKESDLRQRCERTAKCVEDMKAEYAKCLDWLAHPRKRFKGFVNAIQLIFMAKAAHAILQKWADDTKRSLDRVISDNEDANRALEDFLRTKPERDARYEAWEARFLEWGYRYED